MPTARSLHFLPINSRKTRFKNEDQTKNGENGLSTSIVLRAVGTAPTPTFCLDEKGFFIFFIYHTEKSIRGSFETICVY